MCWSVDSLITDQLLLNDLDRAGSQLPLLIYLEWHQVEDLGKPPDGDELTTRPMRRSPVPMLSTELGFGKATHAKGLPAVPMGPHFGPTREHNHRSTAPAPAPAQEAWKQEMELKMPPW